MIASATSGGGATRPATPRGLRRERVSLSAGLCVAAALLITAPVQGDGTVQPDRTERPLPPIERVLSGLIERGALEPEQRRAFAERYAHVRTRVREERSPAGKLRQRTEERQVHDPGGEGAGPGRGGPSARQKDDYEERDIPVTDDLLQRFVFEVEGREASDGRAVVRVGFRPAAEDLPQHNLIDRFINRTAGTLWLEESTFALVKARLALVEEVSFFVGIAGVVHSLNVVWERAATPDGLWYTRRGAWQADFRQFLVRKVVKFEERRDEVRPVAPESTAG